MLQYRDDKLITLPFWNTRNLETDFPWIDLTIFVFILQNVEENKELKLQATSEPAKSLQMHELSSWQHYKYPVNSDLLEEMCISNSKEETVFVFRNQNDVQV